MDSKHLEQLSKQISKLTKEEHIEIFRLLYENDLKYTENNNGIFIQMEYLDKNQIEKIEKYLEYIEKKQFDIDNREKQMNNFKKDLNIE
jgi:hypothetical protein|tara:strand:+ start:181 stop:447 length:267 start_codon:yes stop_codon:yes gene_type:complete